MRNLLVFIMFFASSASCVSDNSLYFVWCPPGDDYSLRVSTEASSTYLEGYVLEEDNYYIYTDTKNIEHFIPKRCLITGIHEDLYELVYNNIEAHSLQTRPQL